MSANAQKEIDKNQESREFLVREYLMGIFNCIKEMVNSSGELTVEEAIKEDIKNNPKEQEKIEKIGKAISLQKEEEEKLLSRVNDTTHTFDNDVPENDFDNRVKVGKQQKIKSNEMQVQPEKAQRQQGGVQRTRDGEDE